AIDYEIARQVEVLESGGKVQQETRLWDAQRSETRAMRGKEEAHDYRYFPEPDLPPLHLEDALLDRVATSLPELPRPRFRRFVSQYGLPEDTAHVLTGERALADYFEAVALHVKDPKRLANWLQGELLRLLKEENALLSALRFTPAQLGELLGMVEAGTLSASAAKEVFAEMFRTGRAPRDVVAEKGLAQESDVGAVEAVVDQVLAACPKEVAQYQAGKKQVLGFLVGQVMRAMKGKGNPALVNQVLKSRLGE
ncbi:MAG: Asp-tRNA(Asn)/Glu-tRNA(Gln) amidotransferase GatCAB subunit B, partial [Myxococcaceae bacterium]|nr:Asp-tRNA(Asn)/Glu-tRNA(Gln) amidotransferase GatCAB subunit B [Myxococcaceae bacterium]